ncbi:MAG: hypothetical protein AB7V16_12020 [Vulcanibacillus sp.]
MKHLVLVVGQYYPNPSPTGKCAKQYISLLKDDYKIDVIYIQYGLDKYFNKVIDSETVYGLSNWRLLIETWFQEVSKESKHNILSTLFNAGVMLMKIIGRIQSIIFFPNNLRWFYKKAYKTLCKIHYDNPIDVVFTVNSPFSAHLAGELFKKKFKDVRWIAYTVDPYYVGFKNKRFGFVRKSKKALEAERKILSKADMNLISEEIYENSKILYENNIDKVDVLPYLIEYYNFKSEHRFDSNKINLVYAGRFYQDIRNPEYLLRTFLSLQNTDIILHLYTTSDCERLINDYVNKSEGRIIRHEMVDSFEIKKVYASADFLINVGNSILEFKPSKTFDYISTGKPIIHFFQNGIIDEVLMRYPLSLQVDTQDQVIINNKKIIEFIHLNKGKIANKKEIEEGFYCYSSKNIKSILYSSVSD